MGNLRFTWLHENLFVEFWENGQALAQLKASVDFKTGAALHVSDVQVIPEARGRRISSELFAKALEIAGPRITSITPGEGLAHSNFEKVANRYFEITDIHSPDYIPGLTKAEATRIAVQASYFAKSIDQFGFTEVSDAKIDWFFADAWSPTSIVGIKAVFSKKTP